MSICYSTKIKNAINYCELNKAIPGKNFQLILCSNSMRLFPSVIAEAEKKAASDNS